MKKTLKKVKAYIIAKIGVNKGKPRIWLEGKQYLRAGFVPGARYSIVVNNDSIILTICSDGTRIVSKKKEGDNVYPILDVNSAQALNIFEGFEAVRIVIRENEIHILPLIVEKKCKARIEDYLSKVEKGEAVTMGSFAHGGGVLSHAAEEGMKEGGLPARLKFANEIRQDMLDHASAVNSAWDEETQYLNAPLQHLVLDDWTMERVGQVNILEGGIPCSGASRSGRSKNKLDMPEAHEQVGHLVAAAIALVAKTNPLVFVLENVPEYAVSASAYILRYQLRDMGYEVHERILAGRDFNSLENRKRWCMVAMTRGIPFSFDDLEVPEAVTLRLGDILENIAPDDPRWSRMEGLKAKQERDKEAGKGFMMQLFDENSDRVSTITKGYAKVRSTDPKIKHPTDPDLLRQLTPVEHARAKQVPVELIKGLCQTTAHELLGQGIDHKAFVAVFTLIGKTLRNFAAKVLAQRKQRQPYQLFQKSQPDSLFEYQKDSFSVLNKAAA